MFKKSFFLILSTSVLLSGLILFLIGCSPGAPIPPGSGIGGFVGGVTGLDVKVMDGAPPSIIMDAGLTPFSFVVSLENVGEAEVGPGTDNPLVLVRLIGIMYNNFGLTESTAVKTLDSRLAPAKKNFDGQILPGEMSYVSFENLAYEPDVFESLPLIIVAEVCYDYETYVTTQFCMKRDVLDAWEDDSICTLTGLKPVGMSGAPLQVTGVEEHPVSNNTVQINFIIENLGNGAFFYRNEPEDFFDACVFDDRNPHIYTLEVFVEPIQENTYDIECLRLDEQLPGGGAHGTVRMFGGAPTTISCFLERTQPTEVRVYQDILNIKLRYRYGLFIEVPILIQGHY